MDSLISLEFIISLITAIGLGGIFGAFFQSKFQHQREIKEDIHNLKRQRYGAILIQMLTIIEPEHGLIKSQKYRPDLKSIDDFKEEIKIEMLNSVLYANDDVIKSVAEFVENPNHSNYIKTAIVMRQDLWNRKTKIGKDILKKFVIKK